MAANQQMFRSRLGAKDQRLPLILIRLALLGAFFALWLWPTEMVLAQGGPGLFEESDDPWIQSIFGDSRRGKAFGVQFRAGHQAGDTIGLPESLTHLEAMPYAFFEETMPFMDFRIWRTNEGQWGGNGGIGVRHYMQDWDRILGAAVYYDRDNASGKTFEQVALSLETLGEFWDLRANFYGPVGTRDRVLRTEVAAGSQRFTDNRLLFDLNQFVGAAMKGLDLELGAPIPGETAEKLDLRAFAGWYHFQSDSTPHVNGFQGRLQGNITPNIEMQVKTTIDGFFKTNVIFGVAWSYGGYREDPEGPRTQFNRMTEPVNRLYNVVVAESKVVIPDQIALNPDTGDPYFFLHVNSNAGGPLFNGTVENPFLTIQTAQGADVDPANEIIFVHADSVFDTAPDNSIVLNDGDIILGEGEDPFDTMPSGPVVNHFIDVQGIGLVQLPRVADDVRQGPDIGIRPTIENSTADAVRIANSSEFSGFIIDQPGQHGFFANVNVTESFRAQQTDVLDPGEDGIRIENSSGSFTFIDSAILDEDVEDFTLGLADNPAGADLGIPLHIINGDPLVRFTSTMAAFDNPLREAGRIENDRDFAVLITGTTGGAVNMRDAEIIDDGGRGISILGSDGDATFDNVLLDFTGRNDLDFAAINPDPAIYILDSSGSYTFRNSGTPNPDRDTLLIQNPRGRAIEVDNLAAGGQVIFRDSQIIRNRNIEGILVQNSAGSVTFGGDLGTQLIDDTNLFQEDANADPGDPNYVGGFDGTAITLQTSSTNMTFEDIVIDNSDDNAGLALNGYGINVTNNIAGSSFRVTGTADILNVENIGVRIANSANGLDPVVNDLYRSANRLANVADATRIEIFDDKQPTVVAFQRALTITDRNNRGILINNSRGQVTFADVTFNPGNDFPLGSATSIDIRNSVPSSLDANNRQAASIRFNGVVADNASAFVGGNPSILLKSNWIQNASGGALFGHIQFDQIQMNTLSLGVDGLVSRNGGRLTVNSSSTDPTILEVLGRAIDIEFSPVFTRVVPNDFEDSNDGVSLEELPFYDINGTPSLGEPPVPLDLRAPISIAVESVDASLSDAGIRLINTPFTNIAARGTLEVRGANGDGGEVDINDDGVLLQDGGIVVLNNMSFDVNDNAIDSRDTFSLSIGGDTPGQSQIQDSLDTAVLIRHDNLFSRAIATADDPAVFVMFNTILDNNGTINEEETMIFAVRVPETVADAPDPDTDYIVQLFDNEFTDNIDDAVVIQNFPTARGSDLEFLVSSLSPTTDVTGIFETTTPFDRSIFVQWDGGVDIVINSDNQFDVTADGATAIEMDLENENAFGNDAQNVIISANVFDITDTDDDDRARAILINAEDPINIQINNNIINLTGDILTGIEINGEEDTNIAIFDNIIDGSTATDSIGLDLEADGPSFMRIENNTIFIEIPSGANFGPERGIVIDANGNTPVQLLGTISNTVQVGDGTTFETFVDIDPNVIGTIIVNGVAVP